VASFDDLTPCDYFGTEFAEFLRAVGWLAWAKPFALGAVDRRVYDRLVEFQKDPWQPSIAMGHHACDLCQHEAEALGRNNLFIPGNGFLYVCPELIVHYVNVHRYAPPVEFCEAVLASPPMGSMNYLKAVLANGGRALVNG
jgi:hypothetical protein